MKRCSGDVKLACSFFEAEAELLFHDVSFVMRGCLQRQQRRKSQETGWVFWEQLPQMISSSRTQNNSANSSTSRESGKFWDVYEWTDESTNIFLEFLKEILRDPKGSFIYNWEVSNEQFLTSERFSELNGEWKLGLSFEEFKQEVEMNWDSLRFWWMF